MLTVGILQLICITVHTKMFKVESLFNYIGTLCSDYSTLLQLDILYVNKNLSLEKCFVRPFHPADFSVESTQIVHQIAVSL